MSDRDKQVEMSLGVRRIPGLDRNLSEPEKVTDKLVEYIGRISRGVNVDLSVRQAYGISDHGLIQRYAQEYAMDRKFSRYVDAATGNANEQRLRELAIVLRGVDVKETQDKSVSPNDLMFPLDLANQDHFTMLLACKTKLEITERGSTEGKIELMQPVLDEKGKIVGVKRYLMTDEQAYWVERDAREAIAKTAGSGWQKLYPDTRGRKMRRSINSDGSVLYTAEGISKSYPECYPDCPMNEVIDLDVIIEPASDYCAAYDSDAGVIIIGKKALENRNEAIVAIATTHEFKHRIWDMTDIYSPGYRQEVLNLFNSDTPGLREFAESIYSRYMALFEFMNIKFPDQEQLHFKLSNGEKVSLNKDYLVNELLAHASWKECITESQLDRSVSLEGARASKLARACLDDAPDQLKRLLRRYQLLDDPGSETTKHMQRYVGEAIRRHLERQKKKVILPGG